MHSRPPCTPITESSPTCAGCNYAVQNSQARVFKPKDAEHFPYVHPAPEVACIPVTPDDGRVCASARGLAKYAEKFDWSVTITYARGWTLPWTLSGARCESRLIDSLALRMWCFPDRRAVMSYVDGKPEHGFVWREKVSFPQRIDKITAFKGLLVNRKEAPILDPIKDPEQAWDVMWDEVLATDRGKK